MRRRTVMHQWLMFRVFDSLSVIVGVYISVLWSPIALRDKFAFRDVKKMVDWCYTMCDPIAGPFVILDLIPVVIFKIEFDWEIRAFEENEVSDEIGRASCRERVSPYV